MALQDYAKLSVAYNGNWLTQINSIERTTNGGQQRVDLLNEGLGGFTPGTGDETIVIGYSVPINGTEDEFQRACATGEYVTMQLVQGRHDYVGRGKILDDKVTQSTNESVSGTFTWLGPLRPFEG